MSTASPVGSATKRISAASSLSRRMLIMGDSGSGAFEPPSPPPPFVPPTAGPTFGCVDPAASNYNSTAQYMCQNWQTDPCCIFLSAPVSAQTTQVQVLEMFYNATNGAGWATKTNWMNGSDPCTTRSTWHGVTCSGGEVTSLSLYSNGLTGTLPTEVGQLTAITQSL